MVTVPPALHSTRPARPHRLLGRIVVLTVMASLLAGGTFIASACADAPTGTSTRPVTTTAPVASLKPAVRLSPPTAAGSASAIDNVSDCRTDLPGAVGQVSIASISYSCPLYSGTQSTIDEGAATWVSQPASITTLATHTGGGGTIWLAGHRTSHGGAFAAIPDLANGAVVTVTDATGAASYRVVGRAYVAVLNGVVLDASGTPSNAATWSALLRPDLGDYLAPRLVIQTCDGDTYRWMIYADLITS
jgi:hypothetical protein